jgi:hypothetical protein
MHIHFKTGIIMAGSAAFVMVAINLASVNKTLHIVFKPTPPGRPANVITQAAVPLPVLITKQNASGFTLKINTQGNPSGTEYAVMESSTGKWIDPTAKTISGDVAVWAPDLGAWDTPRSGIVLTGLVPNRAYVLFAKARNSAKEETNFGEAALGITVPSPDAPMGTTMARVVEDDTVNVNSNANANVNANSNTNSAVVTAGLLLPGRPAVVRLNPKEIVLTIDPAGNTSSTSFAIQDAISGKYVQANGSLGSDPFFRIFIDWGGDSGFVIKTEPNHSYRFQVLAKPRGDW